MPHKRALNTAFYSCARRNSASSSVRSHVERRSNRRLELSLSGAFSKSFSMVQRVQTVFAKAWISSAEWKSTDSVLRERQTIAVATSMEAFLCFVWAGYFHRLGCLNRSTKSEYYFCKHICSKNVHHNIYFRSLYRYRYSSLMISWCSYTKVAADRAPRQRQASPSLGAA